MNVELLLMIAPSRDSRGVKSVGVQTDEARNLQKSMTQMASEKILIVDDSSFNRKLLRLLLKNDGYELREAEDAGRALQILEAWHPELILMDVRLPGTDGLELTRLLKASGETRGIAVVAISASWTTDSQDRARQVGCEACVERRFDAEAFPKLVAGILARHKAPKQS